MDKPFSVYNTWGFHDSLGDRVALTEKLALNALKALERWRADFGLGCDYFVLDYGWFDPRKGYRRFHPEHWPRGPRRVLERIRDAGMTPGLWFSTNGARLRVPAWKKSLGQDNFHYSLIDGPYGDLLEDALHFAAEEWGVRYFKFDFAALATAVRGTSCAPEETWRLSLQRLEKMLRLLRADFPDVRALAHCGFAHVPSGQPVGSLFSPRADPSLLGVFDQVFAGDPMVGNCPQSDLCRARDLDQDQATWQRWREGFPLRRVDDHGVMVGATNTCFYLGRRGFRRSHLAQLARGGRRDLFYGNPSLLTDSDLEALARQRALFFAAFEQGCETTCVGPAPPGLGPWHGFLTGGGGGGLLYLVNSTLQRQEAALTLPGLSTSGLLFFDGQREPLLSSQPDHLRLSLGPEQAALVGFGAFAAGNARLEPQADVPVPTEARLLPLAFRGGNGGLTATIERGLGRDERLLVLARIFEGGADRDFQAQPLRIGKQNTSQSRRMKPDTHELLRITLLRKDAPVPPETSVPAVPVFCGSSWVARTFRCTGRARVVVTARFDEPARIDVRAYALRYV